MRFAAVLTAALAALLAPASAAFAQGTVNAPPGNSGIGQYVEVVPGATGNRPTRGTAGSKARGPFTARQRRALERLGRDGRDLTRFIAATAPSAPGGGGGGLTPRRGAPNGSSSGGRLSPKAERRSERAAAKVHAEARATALASSLAGGDGGGGMGAALPILMVASAVIVLGGGLLGRRRSAPDPEA